MNNTLCAKCEYGVVWLEERPPVLHEILGFCLMMDREVGPVRNCTGFLQYSPDSSRDDWDDGDDAGDV